LPHQSFSDSDHSKSMPHTARVPGKTHSLPQFRWAPSHSRSSSHRVTLTQGAIMPSPAMRLINADATARSVPVASTVATMRLGRCDSDRVRRVAPRVRDAGCRQKSAGPCGVSSIASWPASPLAFFVVSESARRGRGRRRRGAGGEARSDHGPQASPAILSIRKMARERRSSV
jgi:hypothetical protein